ncbi:HNH endonuclease signature motif containing protein [Nocardioides sp. NPDC127503]|uniref:HNH endonuclease n=1 Tax=Nocardioides sp. NPDC127503 TaxID=3154516 RepID=UPI003319863A
MTDQDLPEPGSDELRALLAPALHLVYAYIYARRDDPPTMVEIRDYAAMEQGATHSQTDRRVRDLRRKFDVQKVGSGRAPGYFLAGRAVSAPRSGIPPKVRGQVLSAQRCAQCGKTPLEDHIKLEVDHKVPLSWGGTDDIDNLQPLCEQCNHDKQAFYSSLSVYDDQIREAAQREEPHRRIGDLLLAFQTTGIDAPADVVGAVASLKQYQDDWQRRMRELRVLGWNYKTIKRKENGRMVSYYRLTASAPWPTGNVAAEIRRRLKAKTL